MKNGKEKGKEAGKGLRMGMCGLGAFLCVCDAYAVKVYGYILRL
jgi:hypothetical protein